MKDLFSSEAYRAIVTQMLPGIVGSSTWIIALYNRSPGAHRFLEQSTSLATGALILAAIFWGFVCEDIGSRIEEAMSRWQLPKVGRAVSEDNWHLYLRTVYAQEPVGIRYMRTLVTRMKFELNGAIALVSAAAGLAFARVTFVNPLLLAILLLAFACYLLAEGWSTIRLLRKLREVMQQPVILNRPENQALGDAE